MENGEGVTKKYEGLGNGPTAPLINIKGIGPIEKATRPTCVGKFL